MQETNKRRWWRVDLKTLQAFVMLAEELHFTRAAERLGMAQPLLSQWIRKLERELDAPVVERSTRAVRLTPAGEAALPHARQAVESTRLLQRAVDQEGVPVLGSVTLGYAGASSRPWLPAIARAIRREAPGVDLRLRSMVYAGSTPSLVAAGALDIAFGRRPLTYTGLVNWVFEYERVPVDRASDHSLASRAAVDLRDVAGANWVMFSGHQGSSVRDMGMRLTRRAGFSPRIVQEAPDSYTILGLVAAGVGVTLTVSSVSHVKTPGLALVPVAGPALYLVATVLHRANPTRAVSAALDVVAALHPEPRRPPGVILD